MSTWYPIGPAHVFWPELPMYDRVTRENERAAQGTVVSIAIDSVDRGNILVVDRPDSGGSGLWRSQDGGLTWSSVIESINRRSEAAYGPGTDPTCVVPHPNVGGYAYLGTGRRRALYVSSSGGDDWQLRHQFAGAIRSIIVNPRTGAPPDSVDSTELFVNVNDPTAPGNAEGIWHSTDNGGSFTRVFAGGRVESFAPYFSDDGDDAYVFGQGNDLFFSPMPLDMSSWQIVSYGGALLPGQVGDLPSPAAGRYSGVRIARSPIDRDAVWVWAASSDSTGLYRRTPEGTWEQLADSLTLPNPTTRRRNFVFGIAPRAAGSQTDTLFFGGYDLFSSTDGGATWQWEHAPHPDIWAIEFRPSNAAIPGSLTELWIGSDGGVASTTLDLPGSWREMNRGKYGSAAYQMAVPEGARTLTYIGCQDTAIAVGGGSLTWMSPSGGGGDAGAIAAEQGPTGIRMWSACGPNDYPRPFIELRFHVDDGTSLSGVPVRTTPGNSYIAPTSNFLSDGNGGCLIGGIAKDRLRMIEPGPAPPPPGDGWAYLSDITRIQLGQYVTVDPTRSDSPHRVTERRFVTPTGGWFQLEGVRGNLGVGTEVALNDACVFRADAAGRAVAISQSVAYGQHVVRSIAFDPRSPIAFAGTRRAIYLGGSMNPADNPSLEELGANLELDRPRVYRTTGGVASLSNWVLADDGRPAVPGKVSSIAVTPAGIAYVMLEESIDGTPLFRIDGTTWTALRTSWEDLPAGFRFGKIVLDPRAGDLIYAAYGPRVYVGEPVNGGYQFTRLGVDNTLPDDLVVDLWIGDIGTAQTPKVLLRACLGARGVWEVDVTAFGAAEPPSFFYMRDNILDDGRVQPSPSGLPNPLVPAEYVWWWQSPDIRVETVQGSPGSEFFQTDPEWDGPTSNDPLPAAMFNMLRDSSLNLVEDADARVHVQVQNRSRTAASARVVVLATTGASGLPNLDLKDDGTTFQFWDLFLPSGDIDLAVWPADAVWQPIGIDPAERTAAVTDVTADSPQVATRQWHVPALPQSLLENPPEAHRCLVAIAHAPNQPLPPTGRVDLITPTYPWMGCKNLHIVRMSRTLSAQIDEDDLPTEWRSNAFPVEFHNSEASQRIADLVLDIRSVSPGVQVEVRLVDGAMPRRVSGAKRAKSQRHKNSWRGRGGTPIVLGGVRLPPLGSAKVLVRLAGDASLVEGTEVRFDIMQRVKKEVVGGSTYIVRIGDPVAKETPPVPSDPEEATQMSRLAPLVLAAPWMENVVEYRLRLTGRYPDDGTVKE